MGRVRFRLSELDLEARPIGLNTGPFPALAPASLLHTDPYVWTWKPGLLPPSSFLAPGAATGAGGGKGNKGLFPTSLTVSCGSRKLQEENLGGQPCQLQSLPPGHQYLTQRSLYVLTCLVCFLSPDFSLLVAYTV